MIEIIEPHGGKAFDPACGSDGMFVQSAQFIEAHREELKGTDSGEIKQASTYYEDPYDSFGAFPRSLTSDDRASAFTSITLPTLNYTVFNTSF